MKVLVLEVNFNTFYGGPRDYSLKLLIKWVKKILPPFGKQLILKKYSCL